MVIDAETGRIMQYIRIYDISGEGNFTMEDAKKKAVEIAESEFGKGALDDYIIWFESTSEDRFSIHYSRKLGDYVTNEADSFRIAFGLDGEVLSYNVNNFGDLEGVLGMLTEENLKKAEETLRGALKEDAKVQEDLKQIYIDTVTGVCYIRFSVNGEGYYINIY